MGDVGHVVCYGTKHIAPTTNSSLAIAPNLLTFEEKTDELLFITRKNLELNIMVYGWGEARSNTSWRCLLRANRYRNHLKLFSDGNIMANCTKAMAKRREGGVVDSYDYDYLTKLSFSFWLLRCNAGQSLRLVTQKVWPNWHRNCWKPRANCRDRTGPLRPDGPLSPWRWNRKPSYTSTYGIYTYMYGSINLNLCSPDKTRRSGESTGKNGHASLEPFVIFHR